MKSACRADKGMTLVELIIVCFIVGLIAGILVTNLQWGVIKTRLIACEANLRNISTAIQVYYVDADGFYPRTLDPIFPAYMQAIPACPSTKSDTYTGGYEVSDDLKVFTLCCKGRNHTDYGCRDDQPYFSLFEGMQPPPP